MLDRILCEHRDDGLDRLLPDRALLVVVDAERLKLGDAGALAGAELDAPVRYEVERGDALGTARRVRRRQLHDAVAQPDLLRALAGRAEKHLRGWRVRVFLKEMMLDLPGIVVAEPVGQFDLIERVLIKPVFSPRLPRARYLQLVENAEFHARSSCGRGGSCRPTGDMTIPGTGMPARRSLPMRSTLRTYRLTLSRETRASEVRDGDESPGRKTVPPALLYRWRMGRRDRSRDDPGPEPGDRRDARHRAENGRRGDPPRNRGGRPGITGVAR